MSNRTRKPRQEQQTETADVPRVDLDALRLEAETYERVARAGERLLAVRASLVTASLPALPEDLALEDVLAVFAGSDPREEIA